MAWWASYPWTAVLASLLLAAGPGSCVFDCSRIEVDGFVYRLQDLGGARSIVTSQFKGASYTNTSYTLDLCADLKVQGNDSQLNECPAGTRVCSIRRFVPLDSEDSKVEEVFAIAGELEGKGGGALDVQSTRLVKTSADADSYDGLRLVLQGGAYLLADPPAKQVLQRATIDFVCDEAKTGMEGFWKLDSSFADDSPAAEAPASAPAVVGTGAAPADHDEHQLKSDDSALLWHGYGPASPPDDKTHELRLQWHTSAVCPQNVDRADGDTRSSWGVFPWLVIIVFLGVASYLIFGSWLNYHRDGARGWDLLPHSDMLRDVPYLLRDWARKVLNTVQGTGSRGGYSAV